MSAKCKCSLRTKLVGDGCEICNPELSKEFEAENFLCLEVNTKVMVSEDGQLWLRRYLHHTERSISNPDRINAYVFPMGCDSWTYQNLTGRGMSARLTVWTRWRLPEEDEL